MIGGGEGGLLLSKSTEILCQILICFCKMLGSLCALDLFLLITIYQLLYERDCIVEQIFVISTMIVVCLNHLILVDWLSCVLYREAYFYL